MPQPPGYLAYEGPSVLDPTVPIFAAVTRTSHNRKTGPMAQVWILRADLHPVDAAYGEDQPICGSCVYRARPDEGVKRSCYVNVAWAPAMVYKAYRQGLYATTVSGTFPPLRLGAYGDPAAVPYDVWRRLLWHADSWAGYTHLWRTCDPTYRHILMASVDSLDEAREAQAMGWRTYRVRIPGVELLANEIVCPASDEAGHKATCLTCRLCMGTSKPAKSIAIYTHGRAASKTMVEARQGRLFTAGRPQ